MFKILKHKVFKCQIQGPKICLDFFKELDEFVYVKAHSLEVWWLHGMKLQRSHRNALHGRMH